MFFFASHVLVAVLFGALALGANVRLALLVRLVFLVRLVVFLDLLVFLDFILDLIGGLIAHDVAGRDGNWINVVVVQVHWMV